MASSYGHAVSRFVPRAHRAVIVGIVLAAGLSLSACTAGTAETPDQAPTTAPGEPTTAPAPAPTSGGSGSTTSFDKSGTAESNKAYFDATNKKLTRGGGTPNGRQLIDNLVKAGFPKKAMELTPDKTAIDLDADTIEFSVLIGDSCLLGQRGEFGYRSAVVPSLSTGKCLVGKTRSITW